LSFHARAIVFVVPLLATLFALWVLLAWSEASFPRLARHRRGMIIALGTLVVVDRGTDLIVVRWHDPTATLVHAALVVVMTTLILGAAPVALLYGAARATERVLEAKVAAPEAAGLMTRRRAVEAAGGAAIFGATGSMLGWGMLRGRHAFELVEVPLRIPGLPRVLDGYVIAQVSDLHSGAFVGERQLDEGFSLVRRARPDLVVVTGDVVDFDPAYAPLTARKLADLPARDGIAAILGNHDYYAGADEVLAALGAVGIDLLRNTGRVIRPGDGRGFALLGVDDVSSRRRGGAGPRLDFALATVRGDASAWTTGDGSPSTTGDGSPSTTGDGSPSTTGDGSPSTPDLPCILLSHQPVTVDLWPGKVAAQLSGHTHGGQINPGFSPLGLMMKYVAGSYSVGGTTLYVNRGFGTVGPPSRIGAPPEVTRFVLVAS
jgi:predicted MPP superfamily phosphohydrolase